MALPQEKQIQQPLSKKKKINGGSRGEKIIFDFSSGPFP